MFRAEDLACRRGGRLVVEGVAFALGPGDALVLRGPNGSGKSSLLRLLAGFDRPAAGRLTWEGADVALDPPAHRVRLHHLGHADAVKGLLTVRENLAFAAALAGGSDGAVVDGALAAFGLEGLVGAPARLLSAGQRRRLALARLLAAPRPLWLLDEPGVGLDAASRARLEAVLADHRTAGGLAVLASHGDVTVPDPLVLELGG
ncbi:MAG TPA: heme ABC exporter ATP-binding protein CcmA [Geminicoccaceae bacterium]|nr:heme ABC exporter ATP-binding protein CcmA [Geminicoccaceae bacterium]